MVWFVCDSCGDSIKKACAASAIASIADVSGVAVALIVCYRDTENVN